MKHQTRTQALELSRAQQDLLLAEKASAKLQAERDDLGKKVRAFLSFLFFSFPSGFLLFAFRLALSCWCRWRLAVGGETKTKSWFVRRTWLVQRRMRSRTGRAPHSARGA
jgi:hypothetical protein